MANHLLKIIGRELTEIVIVLISRCCMIEPWTRLSRGGSRTVQGTVGLCPTGRSVRDRRYDDERGSFDLTAPKHLLIGTNFDLCIGVAQYTQFQV